MKARRESPGKVRLAAVLLISLTAAGLAVSQSGKPGGGPVGGGLAPQKKKASPPPETNPLLPSIPDDDPKSRFENPPLPPADDPVPADPKKTFEDYLREMEKARGVAPEPAEPPRPSVPEPPYDPKAAGAIKPLPPVPIPDNPPPHEGAMIDLPPYVVRPPDIIRVEILQASPGKPLTGERLVRPDGTINLDFYGDLKVSGLTADQIKVKVIHHLRKHISAEILGLVRHDNEGVPEVDKDGVAVLGPPEDSESVFVDIAAFNSAVYYVLGDVGFPGRFPVTGDNTALDALQFAQGFLPTAEPNDVTLVRPAHAGKPPRILKVDVEAIQRKGDSTTNYQLFPGDRIYVGRNAVVEQSVRINRLAEPFSTVVNQLNTIQLMMRGLNTVTAEGETPLTATQRQQFVREWADFWWKSTRPGGPTLDEKTFKEMINRNFNPGVESTAVPVKPPANQPSPAR